MVVAVVALAALPIIGLLLWLVKLILKLSFSVAKVIVVLLVIWLIFSAITGGLSDMFGSLGKSKITTDDQGNISYQMAFGDEAFNLGDYVDVNGELKSYHVTIDSALSRVTVVVPQGVIIKLNIKGAIVGYDVQPEYSSSQQMLWVGEKKAVTGSGQVIVEMDIRAAFIMIVFE